MGGLLDHSTNTIILDAVLTTAGRASLARFNGSFQITSFALGDDEIQYGLIRQYGRVIGKEYIEKLTPIMEANTRGRISCQSHLITGHSQIAHIPGIGASGGDFNATSKTVTFDTSSTGATTDLEISQQSNGGGAIPPDLKDNVYVIRMRADQFQLVGGASPIVDDDGVAEYRVGASGVTSDGGGKISVKLALAPQLLDGNRYKGASSTGKAMNIANSSTQARGVIKIKGLTSGQTMTMDAVVNKV